METQTMETQTREEKKTPDNFQSALRDLINVHSIENGSDTPDVVLAQYLAECLYAFDKAVLSREALVG